MKFSIKPECGPTQSTARLAQLVERKALNLVVVGSSPTVGVVTFLISLRLFYRLSPLLNGTRFCEIALLQAASLLLFLCRFVDQKPLCNW